MAHATNIDFHLDFDFANNSPETVAQMVLGISKLQADFGLEVAGTFSFRINLFEENQLNEIMAALRNQPDELSQYLLTMFEKGQQTSTMQLGNKIELPPADSM